MLAAKKPSPAISTKKKQFLLITDENFSISRVCKYLTSLLELKAGKYKHIAIQHFFIKGFFHTDISLTKAHLHGSSFHAEGRLRLPDGNSLATLWVVTPIFDSAKGKVKEFIWTGCEINEANFQHGWQFNKSVKGCLINLGRSSDADRVIVFQYITGSGNSLSYFKQRFVWNSTTCTSPFPNNDSNFLTVPASEVKDIIDDLQASRNINSFVKDLSNSWFREQLLSRGVQSILFLPIHVNKQFWGYVGLEQCSFERVWEKVEMNILESFASTFGIAVESEELEETQYDNSGTFPVRVHDTYLVIDRSGKVKYATPGIEGALGLKREAIINQIGFKFIHDSDAIKLKNEIRQVTLDPAYNAIFNIRVKSSGDEWVWMEASAENKLSDQSISGIILRLNLVEPHLPGKPAIEFSNAINGILNNITDGFAALDKNFTVKLWNHVAEKLTGIPKEEIVGKNVRELFPSLVQPRMVVEMKNAFQDKHTVNFDHYLTGPDRWLEARTYPSDDGPYVFFRDITVQKKKELLLKLEKNVLEISSSPATSLKSTIDYFLLEVGKIMHDGYCTVLLAEKNGKEARHISAPRLPNRFTSILDSWVNGSSSNSIGAVLQSKKMIIVEDIGNDPAWSDLQEIASEYSLKALVALPIFNPEEEVVGSLACYYREAKIPGRKEIDMLERIANLLKLIILNKRAEEDIRISNDRYMLASRAIKEAIWDWNMKTNELYWGEGFFNSFGYKTSYKINTFNFWFTHIHPDDRDKVRANLDEVMMSKTSQLWMAEYRFKKSDGNYATVVNKGYLICDKKGDMLRMVGSIEDVTDKKKIEKKLIKYEIDKQKQVAQAVVDAQEKERAKIGKELHDNVNQVLSTAKLFLEVAQTNVDDRTKLIKRSAEQINHAINEIRSLSHTLVPPSISDLGLGESIRDLLQNIAVNKNIKVDYNTVGDIENGINETQKVMLFRIIQEQINNILKHSEAKHLSIQMTVDDVKVQLVVTDDGKGFDPAIIKIKKGMGLSNISSRLQLFNGKVDIVTAPGKGCKLIIKVPRII